VQRRRRQLLGVLRYDFRREQPCLQRLKAMSAGDVKILSGQDLADFSGLTGFHPEKSCKSCLIDGDSHALQPMVRFHPVHCLIGGNYELVQRFAVDPKRCRTHADSNPRRSIFSHCE
jgi:hypothetical protein